MARIKLEERIALVKSMNEVIKNLNDERGYLRWIFYVPDCPAESDFKDIAEDLESFEEVVVVFKEIMDKYLKYGFSFENSFEKPKLKEVRILHPFDLRSLCVRENWFTNGTIEQYEDFLSKVGDGKNITTNKILELAEDIIKYSDLEEGMEIEQICLLIAKQCGTYFEGK